MLRPLRLVAAVLLTATLAGCGASVLPQLTNETQRLPLAQKLYDRGDLLQAIEVLKPYSSTGGGAADIDRAVYLLGQCYLKQKEWGSAELEFDRLLREYPESDSAGSAMFRLADAYFGQSRGPDFDQEYTLKALTQWQAYLRDSGEDHWLRPAAAAKVLECRNRLATKLERTGELYLKLGQWSPAAVYFRNVVEIYPETAPYGAALIGLSVSDARLGRRAEAEARLNELVQQFGTQPLGLRASQALRDIASGKLAPRPEKRGRKSVEGVAPPVTNMPATLGG